MDLIGRSPRRILSVPLSLVLVAILLAACSNTSSGAGSAVHTSTTSESAAECVTGGWLGYFGNTKNNGAEFIQLNKQSSTNGDVVVGSGETIYPSGQAPTETTNSASIQATGSISGTSLILDLSSSGDSSLNGTFVGQVSCSTLTLSASSSGGSYTTSTFGPGTVADYNQAVSALQAQVASNNQRAINALQAANPTGPPRAPGYATLATLNGGSPSDSATSEVSFDHLPLEICYHVFGSGVGTLNYAIGNPGGGPTYLYDATGTDASAVPVGCVSDPGNDTGPESVTVTMTGSGSFIVAIDQE